MLCLSDLQSNKPVQLLRQSKYMVGYQNFSKVVSKIHNGQMGRKNGHSRIDIFPKIELYKEYQQLCLWMANGLLTIFLKYR